AGPLAGMIDAVPVLFVGLILSKTAPGTGEGGINLGSSVLFSLLNWIVRGVMPEDTNLILHPLAFSGWIGLLVTSLNLLPVGQLDGGHVAYAILGSKQRILARVIIILLLLLGIRGWNGWLIWAAIMFFMRLDHPPLVYEWILLDKRRKTIGWIILALFVTTFIPVPFR
ncbi:MAG: site-2 protease family protein, partial [Syntrophales bacterium]|nr:site-2 protease family protein [Syntrophales bacterium]